MTQQTIQPSRPIRCLIVDDEIAAHKNIKYFINQVPGMEFSEGCMNAVKALELVAGQDFDIVFLDVDMPYISGVEFLRIVGRITASVVMTTAHPEFAIDGYDHNVADFLLKQAKQAILFIYSSRPSLVILFILFRFCKKEAEMISCYLTPDSFRFSMKKGCGSG
jgi:CheY-like chemotaxis protein